MFSMTELTVPAAGASSAAGSFLGVLSSTEASAPLAAETSFLMRPSLAGTMPTFTIVSFSGMMMIEFTRATLAYLYRVVMRVINSGQ